MYNLIIEENPFHFSKSHKHTDAIASLFSFSLKKDSSIVNTSSLIDSSDEETFQRFHSQDHHKNNRRLK